MIEAIGISFSGCSNWYGEDRKGRYKKLAPWLNEFNETDWFNDAIDSKVRGLPDNVFPSFTLLKDKLYWKEGIEKEKTDWFRFQESVKEHQRFAMSMIDQIFNRMGVDLRRH